MSYSYRSPLDGCYNNEPSYNTPRYGQQNSSYRSAPYSVPRPPPAATYLQSSSTASYSQRVYRPTQRFEGSSNQKPPQHQSALARQAPRYGERFKPQKYPKELTDLFGALECGLCSVEVGSPIAAKMHYSGKQHFKKIKHYLEDYAKRTGITIEVQEPMALSAVNALGNYCEICDVRMASASDKMLHYSGRQHKKNEQDPANAKKKKKEYLTIDMGKFGIGADFEKNEAMNEEKAKINEESAEFVDYKELSCSLCDVKAVSLDQLKIHLSGKKHRDKLEKKNQLVPKPEKKYKCYECEMSLETPHLFQLHLKGKRHAKTMLKQKMYSYGADYCEVCQLSFTCFDMYDAHLKGKKHEKNSKDRYRETVEIPERESCKLTCKYCPYVGNLDEHRCDKSLLTMDYENLETKFICFPCHNMVFDSSKAYEEHKNSRRHLLCVLNQEGDKEVIGLEHNYCHVCKVQYRTNKEFTNHLFNDKHLELTSSQHTLESKTDIFKCTVCELFLDQEGKDEHLRNRTHLKKVLMKDTIATLSSLATANVTTPTYRCSNCRLVLSNFVAYSDHVLGDLHINVMINEKLRQMSRRKLMG